MKLITLLLLSISTFAFSHNLKMLNDFSFQQDEYAVVQFSADWCGPCKSQYPEMEKAEKTFPQVNFYVIDIDKSSVDKEYNVSSIPNTFFFVNGKEFDSNVGTMSQSEIESKVTSMIMRGPNNESGAGTKPTIIFFILVIGGVIITLRKI